MDGERTVLKDARRFLPRRADYNAAFAKDDVLAGLTVAIVALPLALGFGVTSGAGAAAGLVTAITAGLVAAVFGGSSFQVTGPTGAMTAVLLPIVAHHGVGMLPFVGLGASVILLAMGALRIGRYVQYIPWPVITGFTNGIAVIIFLQQLPGFLGVAKGEGDEILPVTFRTLQNYAEAPVLLPAALGLVTILVMALWQRSPRLRLLPASMAALLAGTLLSLLPAFADVPRIGEIPSSLTLPALPIIPSDGLTDLFRAALAVAVLAALESLLSAVVADSMTIGERHDPDRELVGQGLGNLAAALFGGIPSTAALARTAVNIRSGARTRLAAVVHAVVLLGIALFLTPLAARIPLAVLAGILMVVAMRMIEREAFRLIMRSTRSDAFVLLLTGTVTVLFDLILAIEIGLVAAGVLFIVRISQMFTVDPVSLGPLPPQRETQAEAAEEIALLEQRVVAYRIDGPVFFGAANRFFDQLLKVSPGIRIVILRLRFVPVMDATGVTALRALVERLAHQHVRVFLSKMQPQPQELLERMGVLAELERAGARFFADTESAIAAATGEVAPAKPSG